jgi:hypothetical protein
MGRRDYTLLNAHSSGINPLARLKSGEVERSLSWWLRDWWTYGEARYGERKAIIFLGDSNTAGGGNWGWRGDRVACLVSAEAVAINDDQRVLCVLQDVTDRKRWRKSSSPRIEQVMADTSWFSRSIVEKLATLRRPVSSPSRGRARADLSGAPRLPLPQGRSARMIWSSL